jgi:hypothetical protein
VFLQGAPVGPYMVSWTRSLMPCLTLFLVGEARRGFLGSGSALAHAFGRGRSRRGCISGLQPQLMARWYVSRSSFLGTFIGRLTKLP